MQGSQHKHEQQAAAMQAAATWHLRRLYRAWLLLASHQRRQHRAAASATAHAFLLACEQRLQEVMQQVGIQLLLSMA